MTRVSFLLGFLLTFPALAESTITVASDGSGQFKSVQAAIDSVPANNKERTVTQSKPGTYKERIVVPKDKPMITFRGEDASKTILTYNWSAITEDKGKKVGTSGSCSTL